MKTILCPEAHQRGTRLNVLSGEWSSLFNNPVSGEWWFLVVANNPPGPGA